jgi:5S rRNA maturation endonuclease (ribonuclease M5)
MEKLQLLLIKLVDDSKKGKPIVVEGTKDANVLHELGVSGKVLTAKTGGKSFLTATQEIENLGVPEVILLLDFDRRGREGAKRLEQNLQRQRIKVNLKYWMELRGLVGRDIQCIEGLSSYFSVLQKKINGEKTA